ncbi:MAG: hypothetical protein MUF07_11895 [Steroidobacteraceae bacterium]|jgi:hypothetical protein|nr:hypothetical protein [Steroidobacteraceae bacterium]
MASIDGTWDCVSSTPMGEQKSVMTLKCEGEAVSGTSTTDLETIEITDGHFDGRTFSWKMKITEPFRMSMKGEVVVDGDGFAGAVSAMMMSSDMKGTRRSA